MIGLSHCSAHRRSHDALLRPLDAEARRLNISRQAVIKTMLSRLLDQQTAAVRALQAVSPIDAITLRCEQLGWSRRYLEPLMASCHKQD